MNDQPAKLHEEPEPLAEELVVPEAGEPTDVDQTPSHQEDPA